MILNKRWDEIKRYATCIYNNSGHKDAKGQATVTARRTTIAFADVWKRHNKAGRNENLRTLREVRTREWQKEKRTSEVIKRITGVVKALGVNATRYNATSNRERLQKSLPAVFSVGFLRLEGAVKVQSSA